MKKITLLSLLLLMLASCNNSKNEEISKTTSNETEKEIVFTIPEEVKDISNSLPLLVAGKETQISGNRLLEIGDTLSGAVLDNKADFFDQVTTQDLESFSGYKVIETVPSLDTPVCTMQTKQLEFAAKKFPEVSFITISNDTPFALQRFCLANGIDNLTVLSDARTREFGIKNNLMLPEYSLLTRAIMVVNENNIIEYIEYADEVTSELDLMNALAFLSQKVK